MTRNMLLLTPGVYTPLPTFFNENEDVDLVGYKKHVLRKSDNDYLKGFQTDDVILDIVKQGASECAA